MLCQYDIPVLILLFREILLVIQYYMVVSVFHLCIVDITFVCTEHYVKLFICVLGVFHVPDLHVQLYIEIEVLAPCGFVTFFLCFD